jgi:cholesterol transport system auxiliary component
VKLFRQVCIALTLVGLSACVTVLPETDPVTLYRLDAEVPPAQGSAAGPPLYLLGTPTRFSAAAATDRIMTVTDGEVAYLAGARWASPAPVLFDEALSRAFDSGAVETSLVGYDGAARARHVLRLEVREFVAFYQAGAPAAPVVRLRVVASIVRRQDGSLISEQAFDVRTPAAANRVSTVVEAFDSALGQVLGEIVAWADQALLVE